VARWDVAEKKTAATTDINEDVLNDILLLLWDMARLKREPERIAEHCTINQHCY
jgi:hypothetical protein